MPPSEVDKDLLAQFVPMSALSESHLRELSNHAQLIDFVAGDSLDEALRMAGSTHYLVDGKLRMSGGNLPEVTLTAGEPSARFALASTETVGRHAHALSDTRLLRLERAKISTLLIWAQASPAQSADKSSLAFRDDITVLLLQSRLFARIPPSNIERIGQLIEPIAIKAGEVVVRQGEAGDFYYVIESGRCEVLREQDDSSDALRLAELGSGESFGEEALITDSTRNATVRMLSDGVLLRLTRDYFIELISAPLLHEVSHERAEDLVATGAQWVDVRLQEEYERDGLDDAINVPLGELRSRIADFARDGSYITVCNSGRRAQAGAFLLSQRGLHVCSLRDGIAARRPQKRGIRAIEETLGTLQAELLRADAELENALKSKAHADAAQDIETRALHAPSEAEDTSDRLRQLTRKTRETGEALRAAMERKRDLESAIRDAQARETSAKLAAQDEVKRMRIQAQTRLETEKQRLSELYRDASTKLERVEVARRDAEDHFNAERQRIERELEEARIKMDAEAERIRLAVEQAQRDAESEAARIRAEHQQLEGELRQRTEDSLRKEREHLEEEFSRSIAAQERARQNMELAEAERISAQKESERLHADTASELQQRHRREQLAREAKVRELQQKSEAARQKLEQAQRARDQAKDLHRQSRASLHAVSTTQNPQREQALREEISSATQKLAHADSALNEAQRHATQAAQAEQVAEQTHAAAAGREDELRLQIYEEMQEWIEQEHSRSNEELEKAAQYARELERIHAEKERKREAERHADKDMLSDIESLLSGEIDPLNAALRTHTIAEEKARLLQRAKHKIAEDAQRARAALKEPDK